MSCVGDRLSAAWRLPALWLKTAPALVLAQLTSLDLLVGPVEAEQHLLHGDGLRG